MKVTPVVAAFALATVLACGSSGTIYTLSSGTYTLSNNSAVAPDNCNLANLLHDTPPTTITLTVGNGNVTFAFGTTGNAARNPVPSISGNTIGTDAKTFDFDNNTLPPSQRFNCIETDTITVQGGSLLANDQLNATVSYSAIPRAQNPGTQCTPANLGYKTFPCTSTASFNARKM